MSNEEVALGSGSKSTVNVTEAVQNQPTKPGHCVWKQHTAWNAFGILNNMLHPAKDSNLMAHLTGSCRGQVATSNPERTSGTEFPPNVSRLISEQYGSNA